MNELSYEEVLEFHKLTLIKHGGRPGFRDEGLLLSALAQPSMSWGEQDLYPSIIEKVAALGFSLAKNHAFVDGNKRVSLYAMFQFLWKNGYHLQVPDAEAIEFIRQLADSNNTNITREDLIEWLEDHVEPTQPNAFFEVAAAMPPFFAALVRQGKSYDEFHARIKAHTQERKTLLKNARLATPRRLSKIYRAAASDTHSLNEKWKVDVPIMRRSAEIIEENAPNFAKWVTLLPPTDKDMVFDILVRFGTLLHDADDAIGRLEYFRERLVKQQMVSPELDVPCADLISTIEDIRAIFNQSWFSYGDMIKGLKEKLKDA